MIFHSPSDWLRGLSWLILTTMAAGMQSMWDADLYLHSNLSAGLWRTSKQVPWEAGFSALMLFKQLHGHTNVPKRHKPDPRLGNWCHVQRQRIKKDTLHLVHVRALSNLGFVGRHVAREWNDSFSQLCLFKQWLGHCDVQRTDKCNGALARWIMTQRSKHQALYGRFKSRGVRSGDNLWQFRIERLTDLGVRWTVYPPWMDTFQLLLMYRMQHGHVDISLTSKPTHPIAQWLQRQNDHNTKGTLSSVQKDQLERIGVKWTQRRKKRMHEKSGRKAPERYRS